MQESFQNILTAGGHANSLGRTSEVVEVVLENKNCLEELYTCLFHDDAWVRMRAADALEKICRAHPDWLLPYIDRLQNDLADSTQPSIQWHLAQIYRQVELTAKQREQSITWLTNLLSSKDVDWIVAANSMDTLAQFLRDGYISKDILKTLLIVQQQHKSKAVVKRATKLLNEII